MFIIQRLITGYQTAILSLDILVVERVKVSTFHPLVLIKSIKAIIMSLPYLFGWIIIYDYRPRVLKFNVFGTEYQKIIPLLGKVEF